MRYTWKYWDNRQWVAFSPAVTQQIRDAYEKGDLSVKFTIQRRRYMVDFANMNQMNLDSGYTRPILMVPDEEEKEKDAEESREKEKSEEKELSSFSVEQSARIVQ